MNIALLVFVVILILLVSVLVVQNLLKCRMGMRGTMAGATKKNEFNARGLFALSLGNSLAAIFEEQNKATGQVNRMVNCIVQKIKDMGVDPDTLEFDASKPLLDIHDKYPHIYRELEKCGFFDILGKEIVDVLMMTRISHDVLDKKMNPDDIQHDLVDKMLCVNKLGDFSNIDIWKNVASAKGHLRGCLDV